MRKYCIKVSLKLRSDHLLVFLFKIALISSLSSPDFPELPVVPFLIGVAFSQSDHGCDFDVAWNDLKATEVLFDF